MVAELKELGWEEKNEGGSRVNGCCKNSIRWTEMLALLSASHATKAICLLMTSALLKGYYCHGRLTYIWLYHIIIITVTDCINLSNFYPFRCHVIITKKRKLDCHKFNCLLTNKRHTPVMYPKTSTGQILWNEMYSHNF